MRGREIDENFALATPRREEGDRGPWEGEVREGRGAPLSTPSKWGGGVNTVCFHTINSLKPHPKISFLVITCNQFLIRLSFFIQSSQFSQSLPLTPPPPPPGHPPHAHTFNILHM